MLIVTDLARPISLTAPLLLRVDRPFNNLVRMEDLVVVVVVANVVVEDLVELVVRLLDPKQRSRVLTLRCRIGRLAFRTRKVTRSREVVTDF